MDLKPHDPPVISPENVPTTLAVVFILALLALSLNFVNFERTNQIAIAVANFELRAHAANQTESAQLRAQIRALEARITELEAARPSAPAAEE